jgi:hypothetical protein
MTRAPSPPSMAMMTLLLPPFSLVALCSGGRVAR